MTRKGRRKNRISIERILRVLLVVVPAVTQVIVLFRELIAVFKKLL